MKKVFILFIAFISAFLISRAQTYIFREGFENGIPSTWCNYDVDGDGYSWLVLDWSPHSGDGCVASASYDFDDGALTPNNFLVTPAIAIPSDLSSDNNVALWWWVAAQDGNWPSDHYEIYISTTGNAVDDFTSPAVYTETISTNKWLLRYLDLTPYIGQNIYIAFVHNNCEDEFVMKLDDIEVVYFTEPTIIAWVNEIDFGDIIVGEQSESQPLTFYSALLDAELTLSVEPPFEISPCGSSFTQQLTVYSNTHSTVRVRYAPFSPGIDVGVLSIRSGDLVRNVTLRGTGVDCSAHPLPFHEDFEEDVSMCWTNSDFDEDGKTWMWKNDGYGHSSDGYYLSLSYDAEEWVDIMPNDWLITPQLAIPGNGAHLTWWVAAYVQNWPENTYDVLISTEGTGPGDFYSIYSETVTSDTYRQRMLDLSAYANQNIHIAFAHHTNTEENPNSYGLVIDDVTVEAGAGIIDNVDGTNILLYPNPAHDVLSIKYVNGCELLVCNMLGQILHRETAADDEVCIDTHAFAPGTYFVHVKGNKNCVGKFIVQ